MGKCIGIYNDIYEVLTMRVGLTDILVYTNCIGLRSGVVTGL